MKHKIIVTGGAGFIGSNIALTIQERYPDKEITIIDDFSTGDLDNLKVFKGKVIKKDITDIDWKSIDGIGETKTIFHQAAITDTTVMDKEKMFGVNFDAFKKLVEFCLENNIKLIYASSAATYGNTEPPMKVGRKEQPTNIYGESKLEMDKFVRGVLKKNPRASIIGLRYFNVYGPRESAKGKMASMIWQLYCQIREGKRPLLFKHGEQKRDFVYVKDVVEANLLSMEEGISGIFNVGSGEARSFNDVVKILNRIMGKDYDSEYIDNPYDFYQEFTHADIRDSKEKLEYNPKFNLEKGIKDYVTWINENE